MLTLFILSYTLGAVVTYGAGFSYVQSLAPKVAKRDYKTDRKATLAHGIIWPIAIGIYLWVDGRKPFQSGLKFY